MERYGVTRVGDAALPRWSPRTSLRVMDLYGIQTAVASLSARRAIGGRLGRLEPWAAKLEVRAMRR